MPIDPRIALGVQQYQAPNMLEMAQNAMAIRNAQQTNQLNQMKLAAEQQSMDEANALRNYLTSADLSTPEGLSGLYRYGTAGAAIAKDVAERLKAEQETETSKQLGIKHKFDAASARQSFVDQAMQNLSTNPSDENIKAWVQDAVINGYMDQTQAEVTLQHNLSIPVQERPAFFKQLGMTGAQKSEAQRREEQTALEKQQLKVSQAREAREAEQQRRENDPAWVQSMEQARATGKAIAEGNVAAQTKVPMALENAQVAIDAIDKMIGPAVKNEKGNLVPSSGQEHPGFSDAVGAGFGTRFIPGSDAASFQTYLDQVNGQAFLQAYEILRGGGSITEVEGKKATAARNRMSLAQSESEFKSAANEFRTILKNGMARMQSRLQGTGAAPAGGNAGAKTIVRTGTDKNNKKVVQYSDGSVEYAK